MGNINLVRVDDRLIHGQVMTKWSKGLGTNALYVVDDSVAADEFMKKIYINTNSASGLSIKVYSVDEVISAWENNQFGSDNAIILLKSITSAKQLIESKMPITSLNIGGIAKKPNSVFIINSVGLSKESGKILQEISELGVEVYFQTVPDTKKISLIDALKKL